jgi:hypothetical protein
MVAIPFIAKVGQDTFRCSVTSGELLTRVSRLVRVCSVNFNVKFGQIEETEKKRIGGVTFDGTDDSLGTGPGST